VSLQNVLQTSCLIKLEAIQIRLNDKFHFMHIGFVQVDVKPFIRKGINAPIYVAIGGKRFKKYKSSLLAMINTNVNNRLIFFNCYLEFSVNLSIPITPEALKLDAHIQGDEFRDFKNFAIMYRVSFRLMSTNLFAKLLSTLRSNSRETILLEIEDDKHEVFTPKFLKWEEITISEAQ